MEKRIDVIMSTNDEIIRIALRTVIADELIKYQEKGYNAQAFEEFGVRHGTARIDFAIINGIMHGYEIKSDRDTLKRLPDQAREFSEVFDKMTLIVGKRHLYKAMHMIPEWWGVMLVKINSNDQVLFQTIREAAKNDEQVRLSIARLLWRGEALRILEKRKIADDIRHKPREFIYERLASTSIDTDTLKKQVSMLLISREGWRSVSQPVLDGD